MTIWLIWTKTIYHIKSLVRCRVTFNLCFRFKAKGESDAQIEMDNLLKNPVKGRILSSETSINSWLADNGLISKFIIIKKVFDLECTLRCIITLLAKISEFLADF